ncbi:mitochondrial distribution and morphology proteins-domain-containing protein [Scheffersomyces amazonensis]|uniref:mitochondrial distribution and morphology proteins-domain-containing protein n=1 Tax=Scheffersomyces amazonensis TaxID=1078765 RepID=UPI00315C6070
MSLQQISSGMTVSSSRLVGPWVVAMSRTMSTNSNSIMRYPALRYIIRTMTTCQTQTQTQKQNQNKTLPIRSGISIKPYQHTNLLTNFKPHTISTTPQFRNISTSSRLFNTNPPNQNRNESKSKIQDIKDTILKSSITKAALLSKANSSLSRLLIHLKWPLIRGKINQHSSFDIISAFISWLVMGNILWIILGTTTFGLVVMHSIHYFDNAYEKIASILLNNINDNNNNNNDDNDENNEFKNNHDNSILGRITSSILSYGLGVRIQFQKGNILPELKDGKLRFKNFKIISRDDQSFLATIEAADLTLSFNKWYEGNGIIYDLEIFGMNGKIFKSDEDQPQTHNQHLRNNDNSQTMIFRNHFENIHYQYDLMHEDEEESFQVQSVSSGKLMDSNYKLDHVKIHDSYIEIFNNKETSPLRITIFNCDLPRLSGDKLLIDFFNANNSSGLINDSMFTIHKRQDLLGEFNPYNNNNNNDDNEDKLIRFKLDSVDLGSLSQSNPLSKFNWIVNGKAEIIADIKLPNIDKLENDSESFKFVSDMFSEFLKITKTSEITASNSEPVINDNDNDNDDKTLLKGALAAIYHTFTKPENEFSNTTTNEYVVVNVKVKFYDLKASLPKNLPMSNSNNVPFVSLHDLRSLISFINNYTDEMESKQKSLSNDLHSSESTSSSSSVSAYSPIVIKTTVIEKVSDLYHIHNLSQTKIFDAIISDIYEDMLKLVKLDEKRIINQKSTMWSHSLASQLLLLGLGVIV